METGQEEPARAEPEAPLSKKARKRLEKGKKQEERRARVQAERAAAQKERRKRQKIEPPAAADIDPEHLAERQRAKLERDAKREADEASFRERISSGGFHVGIDLGPDLEACMNERELKSLVTQVCYCYAANRRASQPCLLTFAGLRLAAAAAARADHGTAANAAVAGATAEAEAGAKAAASGDDSSTDTDRDDAAAAPAGEPANCASGSPARDGAAPAAAPPAAAAATAAFSPPSLAAGGGGGGGVGCCTDGGGLAARLDRIGGYHKWVGVARSERPFHAAFPAAVKKVVYLSADASRTLQGLERDTAYIIGGLVDRNRHPGLTQRRAAAAGVDAARLPLDSTAIGGSPLRTTKVLAVNHVFNILVGAMAADGRFEGIVAATLPPRKLGAGSAAAGGGFANEKGGEESGDGHGSDGGDAGDGGADAAAAPEIGAASGDNGVSGDGGGKTTARGDGGNGACSGGDGEGAAFRDADCAG
ncbi:unnamed protein product [Phaeothamnion confervicola]